MTEQPEVGLTGRAPTTPLDIYVLNANAGVVTTAITQAVTGYPCPLSVQLLIGANAGSPTALSVYVEPNWGDANPTVTTLTALGIYMEDIGSATVNHLIGIDIGMNSTNQASDWHTFFRIKGHAGTAKSIFKINAAATYLLDFQAADMAVPLSAGTITGTHRLACRMPDGSTRYLALGT